MATDSRALPAFFNTDTDFRNWCIGIAAQLVVAGMVKTSDTGQINTSTVTKPSATNTAQGYEIYGFNDSLQSGNPVYFKIEYGSGAAVDRPSLWITAGTGTSGAGAITGAATGRAQVPAAASKAAGNTLTSYCQGDAAGFVLVNNYDPTTNTFNIFLNIDRVQDAAGNATTDGFYVAISSSTGTSWAQSVLGGTAGAGSSLTAWLNLTNLTPMPGAGSRSVGSNTGVLPAMIMAGQLRFTKRWVTYNSTDLPGEPATTMSVTNLGAVHTYLLMAHLNSNLVATNPIAILWE